MYEANNLPYPFWGAETTRKTGRDPLAVQNSSVVIYDNMVKGVTNMTERIRYNGFFLLVDDIYCRETSSNKSVKD